jgi:superfamily II DNA helicase RecQ
MPIGAGKSMLFILLAFISVRGVTVVVVLFVTLHYDIKGRSKKVGMSVGE